MDSFGRHVLRSTKGPPPHLLAGNSHSVEPVRRRIARGSSHTEETVIQSGVPTEPDEKWAQTTTKCTRYKHDALWTHC